MLSNTFSAREATRITVTVTVTNATPRSLKDTNPRRVNYCSIGYSPMLNAFVLNRILLPLV